MISTSNTVTVPVNRDVRQAAAAAAEEFRRQMAQAGTLVVHLLSSPGSGKTALLEATLRDWVGGPKTAVLVGDLATDRDAARIGRYAPCVQLTTGGTCHLEIPLVLNGWQSLAEQRPELLFIEDVGNLVCPASFDLGEHLRVSLLSVTEGDDKPGKYPKAFRTSQALVITKTDLLPYVPFSVELAAEDARKIQPDLEILTTSALTGDGIAQWREMLVRRREAMLRNFQEFVL